MAGKAKVASVLVFEDEFGEWRWIARSKRGTIVAESDEGYNNRFYTAKLARSLFVKVPIEWGAKILPAEEYQA